MKWAVLLASSLVAACIAASGFVLLSGLFITRSLSPAAATFERELFFDYTQPEAFAAAYFIVPGSPVKAPTARFLQPGTSMNVWLELVVPDSPDSHSRDMFQVKAELAAADGRVAAATSRPCTITYRSPLVRGIRMLATLPLTLSGWQREQQVLRVPLFKRLRERADVPFAIFRTSLQARSKGELPRLYSATVRVDLNLGPMRRVLYWMRPGVYLTWGLALTGLVALIGGGVASLVLLLLWGLSSSGSSADSTAGGGGGGAKEAGGKPKGGRASEEVSSEAGWSEVSSGDLESEPERETSSTALVRAPSSEPTEPPVTPLSAQALKRWETRSASAHSLVSSEAASILDDTMSKHSKKLR